MATNHPHLILPKIDIQFLRKKHGFGSVRKISYKTHGKKLGKQVESLIANFSVKPQPPQLNPALILKVNLEENANIEEKDWEGLGLKLLSIDVGKQFILFASDNEMKEFSRKLALYKKGPKEGRKHTAYNALFSNIEEVAEIKPKDKLGKLMRLQKITSLQDFEERGKYIIDVQLWDFWNQNSNKAKIKEVKGYVEEKKGIVSDTFCNNGLNLLRVQCKGSLIKEILEQVNVVSFIDFPPTPSLSVSESKRLSISDFPKVPAPPNDASSVAILDSGIVSGHPLLRSAVGEALSVPRSVGSEVDENGHGTMVAGLALYGNVEDSISHRKFEPKIKMYSVRVLNKNNKFDNEKLVVSQMTDAIGYIHEKYGCRVFNLSLGDEKLVYNGGKVGPWAAVLDNICREKNIIIVVSAGNFWRFPKNVLKKYPEYLYTEEASIIEPATGAIVITVGALASLDNVSPPTGQRVDIRPIAKKNQPSPFTRTGPGINGSIKPDLIENGGNAIFDGLLNRVGTDQEMSVLSLNKSYLDKLFSSDVGTSFAAPKVACMAAKLFNIYPRKSANLIRAMLAISADIPLETKELLKQAEKKIPLYFCGYGRPDIKFAQYSTENRVMLYNESRIKHDHVHIYSLPIPDELFSLSGEKRIGVALAFDPPVRETRIDYLGIKMSFRLLRGTTPEEIMETLRRRKDDEDPIEGLPLKYNCSILPGPRLREGGTLQKGFFRSPNKFKKEYGKNYFLVVRCEEKWHKDPDAEQRYAVVVSVETKEEVDIYTQIRQRIPIRARVKA